jgi:hypothetical protein
MKKIDVRLLFAFLLAMIFMLSGCAQNEVVDCLSGHTYGFWGGVWHGLIAPFDFVGMLFTDDIVMYAPNNNGKMYAFGFLLGSGGWGFLAHTGRSNSSRKRYA